MPGIVTSGRDSDLDKILSGIPFLKDAPSELRRSFAEAATVVRLHPGEYFLREGDSCGHFALVISGKMRVFKLAESGHEITLYHVGAGEACPLNVSCILSDRSVPATAQVEEETKAVIVSAALFRCWIAEHESLRKFVFEMFSNRLTEVMSLVEEVAFRRMDERLAHRLADLLLRDSGTQRYVEITHADLAADLGTAREVVSRLLKEFERLGAIHLSRGRIELRNGSVLKKLTAAGVD